MPNRQTLLQSLAAAAAAAPLLAAAHALAADQLGKFQSWTLFMHKADKTTTCFIASQPTEMLPKGANRDAAYFYISAWPKEGVKTEVSVKLGYPVKKGAPISVKIGNDPFKLFADAERGFVADPTEELKLIEAMKKGTTMQVQATSQRGTDTTDTYSLAGLKQALQGLAEKCQ